MWWADIYGRDCKCAICMGRLRAGNVIKTECGHRIHYYKCWREFVKGRSEVNCPLCRTKLQQQGEGDVWIKKFI